MSNSTTVKSCIAGKTIRFLFAILFVSGLNGIHAQNTWTQKADLGGTGRAQAVGFSIGTKGYLGTGVDYALNYKDFWEYDPDANTWAQKADFGGAARSGAVGFNIGTKGYLGTGFYFDDTFHYFSDFWEYYPDSNTWTQKADFGEVPARVLLVFSIGNKGYLLIKQSSPDRLAHRFRLRIHMQLVVDIANVKSYGINRNLARSSNHLITHSFNQAFEDFFFTI
jgi:N-acetylneuraminic acid mutarotase